MRVGWKKALIAAACIVAVGAVAVWLRLPEPGRSTRMVVSSLPASIQVLGRRVTLQKAERRGHEVEIEAWLSEDLGCDSISTDTGTGSSCSRAMMDMRWGPISDTVSVPPGARVIDGMSMTVYVLRPERNVTFRFSNVAPADLPVTQNAGGARMTLEAVYAEMVFDAQPWGHMGFWIGQEPRKGQRLLGMVVRERLPTGYRMEHPYAVVRCSDGRTVEAVATFDRKGDWEKAWHAQVRAEAAALRRERRRSPLKERIVGVIDRPRADEMARERASAAGEIAKRSCAEAGTRLYVFPRLNPMPKRFTLLLPGTLPPKPEDVRTVTFENVPIQ